MDPTDLTQLHMHLTAIGFSALKVAENPIFSSYVKTEQPILYLVFVAEAKTYFAARAQADEAMERITQALAKQKDTLLCTRLIRTVLLLDLSTTGEIVDYVENLSFPPEETLHRITWYISREEGKVHAGIDQPTKLMGLEKAVLSALQGDVPQAQPLPAKKGKPFLTFLFLAICIGIECFFALFGGKNEAITLFGLSRDAVLQGAEIYRIFSSTLLHSGVRHLVSNMVYLYYFGSRCERVFGKGGFLLLCLTGAVGSSVFSLLSGAGGISIGASGVVFALIGAMLLVTRRFGARYSGMNYTTLLLLALSSLLLGLLEVHVDNWAHLGGFLSGMLFFVIFRAVEKRKEYPQKPCG